MTGAIGYQDLHGSDTWVTAAHDIYADSIANMRETIVGVPSSGLNWQPAKQDSNSLTAIITHALGATRTWLCIAFAEPLPQRDRAAEFLTQAGTAEGLLAYVDAMTADCEALFDRHRELDGAVLRAIGAGDGQTTAAWALFHAVEHLREHLGQLYLTRQLWEQSAGR